MSSDWPPLDVHAHVETSIHPAKLLALRAVLLAATRSIVEFESTTERDDPVTTWGVGAHPGIQTSVNGFDAKDFRAALARTPVVSEVGLDARSPVPMREQQRVLHEILDLVDKEARIVSVHSAGSTREALDVVEEHATRGLILHWWRGAPAETARAVALGCWFSINPAELQRPSVLGMVPWDRLLTETDHPYGNRSAPSIPGGVSAIEEAIATRLGTTLPLVRGGLWGNLARLVEMTGTLELFGDRIRRIIEVSPTPLSGPAESSSESAR